MLQNKKKSVDIGVRINICIISLNVLNQNETDIQVINLY